MKILAVSILALGIPAAVQSPPQKPAKRKLADRQWFEGKIVCIGCWLENQEGGADAQCTLHAKHAQGFLAADGTLWTFVDNARGHPVVTNAKLRDKEVRIFGWKFPRAQYVEVWRFQLKAGDRWEDWDYCKVCGFEPGDNQDGDLCGDCKE